MCGSEDEGVSAEVGVEAPSTGKDSARAMSLEWEEEQAWKS